MAKTLSCKNNSSDGQRSSEQRHWEQDSESTADRLSCVQMSNAD